MINQERRFLSDFFFRSFYQLKSSVRYYIYYLGLFVILAPYQLASLASLQRRSLDL